MTFPIPLETIGVFAIGLGAVLITMYELERRKRIHVNDLIVKGVLAFIVGFFIFKYIIPSLYLF